MATKRGATKKRLTKFTMRLEPQERAALERKAKEEKISAAALLRRFIAGIAAALFVACGGASLGGDNSRDAEAGKSSAGHSSFAGQAQSSGTGGSSSGESGNGAGGATGGSGGSGSRTASGGSPGSGGTTLAGSAGEPDAGEPNLGSGGLVGSGGDPGVGGAQEAGAGGEDPVGTGGTGSAGAASVACVEEATETCGGSEENHLVRHTPKPDTYCIKVNFLRAGQAWFDARDDECSLGEPDKVMAKAECFIVFGPAYGAAEPFWVDALYTLQESGDACVNRISKQTYDSNPGNQFCVCP